MGATEVTAPAWITNNLELSAIGTIIRFISCHRNPGLFKKRNGETAVHLGAAQMQALVAERGLLLALALWTFLFLALGGAEAAEEARPAPGDVGAQQSPVKEIDFRAKPFRYKEDIDNATPSIDMSFLLRRLQLLLTPIDYYLQKPARPMRSLSYHMVVRYEAPKERDGFVDVHFPQAEGATAKPPEDETIYHDALSASLATLAKFGNLKPENDAGRADILIHVNLAERLQTSRGFNYETMTRYSERTRQATDKSLEVLEHVLPWTIVRQYFLRHEFPDYKENFRSIEGGEIWMQYPKRTFWEAEVALAALDDLAMGERQGLGANRDAIVARFRTPHRMELQPLQEALGARRPQVFYGAGGTERLDPGGAEAPRPAESLLSYSMRVRQLVEDAIYEGWPTFNSIRCGQGAHSNALAGRLDRALAMFVAGFEAGALRVAPLGDYTSEFRKNPDGFLADFSLAGYQGSFDQRLDDRLVLTGLEELIAARAGRAPEDTTLPGFFFKEPGESRFNSVHKFVNRIAEIRRDEIARAYKDVALGFTQYRSLGHPGGCLYKDDVEEWR